MLGLVGGLVGKQGVEGVLLVGQERMAEGKRVEGVGVRRVRCD